MKKFALLLILLFAPAARAMPVAETTSPGGLTIWHVEDHTTRTLTFSFAFNGGSELDPTGRQGTAALLAAMLTEGAGPYDSSAFAQALTEDNIALSFSGGRDRITGDLRFLLSHTDRAIELTRLALTRPHFNAGDLQRQQAGLLATFSQTQNDPDWRATRLLFQNVYSGTPYAQSSRGTPATVPAITVADLKAALADKIVKSRLVIVSVGALPAAEAAAVADRIFGTLPDGRPAPATPIELQHKGETWFSPWPAAPQAVIQFALPFIAPTDADYPAALVLNDVIGGGGFRARLMRELRQKLGATYGINTSPLNLQAAPVIYGQGTVNLTQLQPALDTIRTVITEGGKGEIAAADLAASKTYLAGAFARDLTSSSAIADFILAARLAGLPRDYYDSYPDRIRAVSESDLTRVARRLFDPAELRFAIVAPQAPAKIDKTVTDLWAVAP